MISEHAGSGCSPGAAVAPAWQPCRGGMPGPVAASAAEVRAAFGATAADLESLAAAHRSAGGASYADILEVEAMIAMDPAFADAAVAALTDDAVAAVGVAGERHAAALEVLESAELRERAADVRVVVRIVQDRLVGRAPAVPPPGPVVLVADEVAAPDLLAHADQLAAAVSVRGGPSSHAAIVARSLGVPFVVGVDRAILGLADGVPLLVDGDAGRVVVDPAADAVPAAAAPVTAATAALRALPLRTRDGTDVQLLANVASVVEARRAVDRGASGVGLLRTELAHLDARRWPTRSEHARALRPVLAEVTGLPVVVRLLDFTHDKVPPFLAGRTEESLELLLGAPGALSAQLEAMLDVGRAVGLRVLVPMVESRAQLSVVRQALIEAAATVGAASVPQLGAMLETPAAIAALPALLDAADFFSLGTNDLAASTLGVARTDPRIGPATAARPEVLSQVLRAADLTGAAGRPLSVCGDAAADASVLPLLLSAGITTLSVAPSRLDDVRALVHAADAARSGRPLIRSGGRGA
jgi:phosphoenolpyruvate-protein kinase (PTS system EI component)